MDFLRQVNEQTSLPRWSKHFHMQIDAILWRFVRSRQKARGTTCYKRDYTRSRAGDHERAFVVLISPRRYVKQMVKLAMK